MNHDTIIELDGVTKAYGGSAALTNIRLSVRDGEFLTLLGPSGCGKTTILRTIAGFEEPDQGSLSINGKNMDGVPPEDRPVNTVFQSYALFPHMTIFDNVAFGLRMQGLPQAKIHIRVQETLDMVGLSGKESSRPDKLSGGQQQRVAMARAIVNRPKVLLLDEPLSALDYGLRKRMQRELKALQRRLGIAFVFVTHDQEEAFSMSDRVAIINEGRVAQVGTPREVYEEPATLFTARFVGEICVFDGVVMDAADGLYAVDVEGAKALLRLPEKISPEDRVHVLVRPEDFLIRPAGETDAKNATSKPPHFSGVVRDTVYKGATYDMTIELSSNRHITATQFFNEDSDEVAFDAGDAVDVSWIEGWEVVLPHERN